MALIRKMADGRYSPTGFHHGTDAFALQSLVDVSILMSILSTPRLSTNTYRFSLHTVQ
jgi:hypothetical protein